MGVLYVDSAGLGRHESQDLQVTFEQLANPAAVAIENARLVRDSEEKGRMERELAVAAEIQMALLPPRNYSRGTIELAGTTVPCRAIGGDFYEYIELADGLPRLRSADHDLAPSGGHPGTGSVPRARRARRGDGRTQSHDGAPEHRAALRDHRFGQIAKTAACGWRRATPRRTC